MVGHAVRIIRGDGSADEGDGVDGRGHVLRLHAVRVAQAADEGRVEVAEGAGTDDDLCLICQ